MREYGTDRYGLWASPLFASVLDRERLALPLKRPPSPGGREWDRAGNYYDEPTDREQPTLTGSNPFHDEDFYRTLYALTDLTGRPEYAQAADDALRYFFTHAQSPDTWLFTWGEHMAWDLVHDRSVSPERGPNDPIYHEIPADVLHEYGRDWLLWKRSYQLAPEAIHRFAHGVWLHQIHDHETGNFSRHARWLYHQTWTDSDYPRHAGFFLRTWADVYAMTGDERLLSYIDVMLRRYEEKSAAHDGVLPFDSGNGSDWGMTLINLSMAIDLAASAPEVPEPYADRMRALAEEIDESFLGLPHWEPVAWNEGAELRPAGLVTCVRVSTGEPYEIVSQAYTGASGAAMNSGALLGRYAQTGDARYFALLQRGAEELAKTDVAGMRYVGPWGLGTGISVLVTAYRETGEEQYLHKAREIADMAIENLWQDKPLPRAGSSVDHYESITGAGSLALGLLELHAAVNDLEVDLPVNELGR
jgi:hypothetical protein